MAATQYADRTEIIVDQRQIAQATNISWNPNAEHSEVVTILLGVAGFTPGPGRVRGTVNSAVPKAGLEVEFDQICIAGTIVEIRFLQGGTKQRTSAVITDVNRQQAAGQTISADITFIGTAPEFLG